MHVRISSILNTPAFTRVVVQVSTDSGRRFEKTLRLDAGWDRPRIDQFIADHVSDWSHDGL